MQSFEIQNLDKSSTLIGYEFNDPENIATHSYEDIFDCKKQLTKPEPYECDSFPVIAKKSKGKTAWRCIHRIQVITE